MATQTNFITVEQYERSFEGCPGYRDELINGRIVMTPDAKPLHQHVQRNIQKLLDAACEGTEFTVNGDSNIKFPSLKSAPSPDVFVVETCRWEAAIRAESYLDTPPLLVVEILSPDQDISEKTSVYLKAEVSELWIVDPRNKTVLMHRTRYTKLAQRGEVIFLSSPLSGFIKVDDIFAGIPE